MLKVSVELTDIESIALLRLKKKTSKSKRELMRYGLALLIAQDRRNDKWAIDPDPKQQNLDLI